MGTITGILIYIKKYFAFFDDLLLKIALIDTTPPDDRQGNNRMFTEQQVPEGH